jgi:hypothetical protein
MRLILKINQNHQANIDLITKYSLKHESFRPTNNGHLQSHDHTTS